MVLPRKAPSEAWRQMVLRSMSAPAWLGADAPHEDVVISTRVRIARNLVGHSFPHHASDAELRSVAHAVLAASTGRGYSVHRRLTPVERDYMLGCRLISPDFDSEATGRLLLLNADRSLGIMVNEEDHLRIQALTAGWSLPAARALAAEALEGLHLPFARAPGWGVLTASPFNAGEGVRLSAMVHLVGLHQSKRLPRVVAALRSSNMVVRGLFGEASRGVAAFFQISMTRGNDAEFLGALDFLMREERRHRSAYGLEPLHDRAAEAVTWAVSQPTLRLGESLRVLAWVRWAGAAGLDWIRLSVREVDALVSTLEVSGRCGEPDSSRATILRGALESTWAALCAR